MNAAKAGHSCAKLDIGCAKCTKGKGGSACLACSTNGPVPAELNSNGRCLCPAGTAKFNSANTVNLPLVGAKVSGSSKSGGGKGGGKGAVTDVACAPCAENAYATIARPVGVSKCVVCPTGTTTRGSIGSTACFVEPGQWFNVATQAAEPCPVDQWCPGGDIAAQGKQRIACPIKSTTQGQTGSDSRDDCVTAPGNYYDAGTDTVKECTQGFYCSGGSVTSADQSIVKCPDGSSTASPGASTFSQCANPPGTFFDGTSVLACPQGSYCPGGSVTGAGTTVTDCPAGSATASAGSSLFSQCIVQPGFYYDGSSVVQCAAGNYCTGGPINNAVQTPCPGVTTSPAGSSTASQCTCNGAECVAGSVCVAYGLTNTPTCVCTATQIPAYTPTAGTCGVQYDGGSSVTQTYTVVPGQSYSLAYNSFSVPDRYDFIFFFFKVDRRSAASSPLLKGNPHVPRYSSATYKPPHTNIRPQTHLTTTIRQVRRRRRLPLRHGHRRHGLYWRGG
jgi:hypothetical protein